MCNKHTGPKREHCRHWMKLRWWGEGGDEGGYSPTATERFRGSHTHTLFHILLCEHHKPTSAHRVPPLKSTTNRQQQREAPGAKDYFASPGSFLLTWFSAHIELKKLFLSWRSAARPDQSLPVLLIAPNNCFSPPSLLNDTKAKRLSELQMFSPGVWNSCPKQWQTMTNLRLILTFVIVSNLYKMGLNVLFQHIISISLCFLSSPWLN